MLDGLMSDYPFLKMLDEEALAIIERNLVQKKVQAGELLINGEEACWGFSFIKSGVLRVYRLNDEGREVTLYEKFLSVIQVVENVTFNSIEQRVIDYLKEHSRGGLLYRTHE